MPDNVVSFKGLAYVVADRLGVKWANNVSVVVKRPGGLRLDAMERISDVTATLVANNGEGYLKLPLEGKVEPLKNGNAMLPVLGEIPIKTDLLADILCGRPSIEGGAKGVSESFHSDKGSYFVRGREDDMEMSAVEKLPLVYTRYTSEKKTRVLFEVDFEDFKKVSGRNFPQHIIVRFEHPKFMMDVRYKEIWPENK